MMHRIHHESWPIAARMDRAALLRYCAALEASLAFTRAELNAARQAETGTRMELEEVRVRVGERMV